MQVCYLDMDGVLVDFVAGAYRFFKQEYIPGTAKWDFQKTMGIDAVTFWNSLDRRFWAALDWMPEGKDLLANLEDRFDEIVILTSPCKTDGCMDGKLDWIKQHIPKYERQYYMGTAKSSAASPRHLLIDDYDVNIEKFAKHGHTMLVPRSWNKDAHKTVNNVFNLVEFFLDLDRKRHECSSA